ncbi:DUF2986 domain-containing protein [Glaciecola sp. 2405UD65-10]|jgi:hypothetical protein|uniref:DUF2986 domain-containing protein n=1 Tax=Glaciecola sp. 2405UD65-10 TaxID=3397244 RepID=UPI003B5A8789
MSRKKAVVNKLLKKARKANKNKQKSNKPRYVSKADREKATQQDVSESQDKEGTE